MLPIQVIKHKIYLVRDCNVMLDRDLAMLYGIKPIHLRQQVKRNEVDIRAIFEAIRRLMGPAPLRDKRPIGFGV
jgi:hypothetical protein